MRSEKSVARTIEGASVFVGASAKRSESNAIDLR